MQTECCECDRIATRFHGTDAYCAKCWSPAVTRRGHVSHCCPNCGVEQGPQIAWRADAPCGKCQEEARK